MDEIDNIIEPSEKVLWRGKPEYAPFMFGAVISAAILFVVFSIAVILSPASPLFIILVFIFAGLILVLRHMNYNRIHYAITNKRLVFQSGIIGRDFHSLDYDKIQSATANVGLIGVIFKVGNVMMFSGKMQTITTGNHGSRTIPVYDTFAYVKEPYEALKKVQHHLSYRKESMYGGYGHPAGKANRR